MTEYEKLRESVGSATRTPVYQKFSEWSVDKQIDDKVRGRLDYADYLRKVHIDAGIATPEIEADIRKGLFSSLIKDGSLEEGDYSGFQKLTEVPER